MGKTHFYAVFGRDGDRELNMTFATPGDLKGLAMGLLEETCGKAYFFRDGELICTLRDYREVPCTR